MEVFMNCNAGFFKTGPCIIAYKGAVIGVTSDGPLLNIKPEFYEAKCSRTGSKTVGKIIMNMKITVSVKIRKINGIVFKRGMLLTGGELSFTPCGGNNNIRYCFPRTVIISETARAGEDMNQHYLKLEFEVFEDSEGILIQKFS